jgi:DNA (cytosine-5)-methyltransferase 1
VWSVLNTADFKVPQRRRRLVLLASKLGDPEFALTVNKRSTVRQAIANLTPPRPSRDPLHNYSPQRTPRIKARIRRIPPNGGSRTALGARNQPPCHNSSDGFKDIYERMAWDKPAPTITGGCINPSRGRFLHPEANRAITLREAALLQTQTVRMCYNGSVRLAQCHPFYVRPPSCPSNSFKISPPTAVTFL